jgi:dipeptidyl aminopeptidase/acylaminoacyl peptidase
MRLPERETVQSKALQDGGCEGFFKIGKLHRLPELGRKNLVQLGAFCVSLFCVATGWPQPNAGQTAAKPWEELAHSTQISEVAISPDGTRVAWVENHEGEPRRLFVLGLTQGEAPTRVSAGGSPRDGEDSPAWAPDSSYLAFVSDAEERGQNEVWVARADGSRPWRVTDVAGYLARPRWSPDGKDIAFLYVEGSQGGGPLRPHGARTGVIEEVIRNQRVAAVDIGSGKVRFLSPPGLHVYEYDWSPDGHSLAVTAAPGPGDNNWWVARLYVVDRSTGNARPIYRPKWQIADPRWSPDGKTIAFIEGLMSDEGAHGGGLYTVSAEGGAVRNHTSGRRATPNWLSWLSPSKILFTEYEKGGSAICTLQLGSGVVEQKWRGPEPVTAGGFLTSFAVAKDGSMSVLIRQSFEEPPEVWAGPIGSWQQLTRINTGQKVRWGKATSLDWTSDGLDVQGWLIPPPDIKPGASYPMVVVIHGGPASIALSAWPNLGRITGALMAAGYFVLLPNPRGSYGQGEAFTEANVKDFGGGDLRDILGGVDAVLARYPVDPHRLGITGWSYGGYMTMWAVTQTNRFQAAVAGAGIANWQSYYGENLIDQWMVPFFGASVYDDPAVYEKSSPIRFIKRVKTPTLVIVGERDAECPAPQSFEFWHALKTLGVPTQLVVYPNEGHAFSDPEHRTDRVERTLAWFAKYLQE